MGIKLYVGNLSYSVKSEDLSEFFSNYGSVGSVKVITDRDTGRSKGFAFVEMDDESEGRTAIEEAHGKEFLGRNLNISEAKPMDQKPRTGGFDRNRGPRRF